MDNLKKDAAKAYLARDDEKKRANSNRDKVEEKVRVVKYLEGQNETLTGQVNKFKNITKTLQVRHPTCIPDHHLHKSIPPDNRTNTPCAAIRQRSSGSAIARR